MSPLSISGVYVFSSDDTNASDALHHTCIINMEVNKDEFKWLDASGSPSLCTDNATAFFPKASSVCNLTQVRSAPQEVGDALPQGRPHQHHQHHPQEYQILPHYSASHFCQGVHLWSAVIREEAGCVRRFLGEPESFCVLTCQLNNLYLPAVPNVFI